jgi:hypothetical protein
MGQNWVTTIIVLHYLILHSIEDSLADFCISQSHDQTYHM